MNLNLTGAAWGKVGRNALGIDMPHRRFGESIRGNSKDEKRD
jgi:hypothetical protein